MQKNSLIHISHMITLGFESNSVHTQIRNKKHGHHHNYSTSPRPPELLSMRAVRPPVSPLYLGYQRSNSNSIPSSPLDISFEINGSTDANLGALRSPTKSNIRTSTTKMKIESPSSIMSIMSITTVENDKAARKALLKAKKENDSMVFVDGPQVYTCSNCRTHLTSHDDIISKSFHGRHGESIKLVLIKDFVHNY